MFWQIFIPIVAFLGLILGILLAKISPEEMKPGKKYFIIFRNVLLPIISIILFYFSNYNILFFIVGLIIGYFIKLDYFYFGLVLAFAFYVSKEILFILASLIFIYGLPTGTLLEKKIKPKQFLKLMAMFFLPFIILTFGPYKETNIVFGLCSGLIMGLIPS